MQKRAEIQRVANIPERPTLNDARRARAVCIPPSCTTARSQVRRSPGTQKRASQSAADAQNQQQIEREADVPDTSLHEIHGQNAPGVRIRSGWVQMQPVSSTVR